MKKFLWKTRFWLWPTIGMLLTTPFLSFFDLAIARYFYEGHFQSHRFFDFLYNYGCIPANATAILALCFFITACFFPLWKLMRAPTLVLVLALALGSGAIVHSLLKEKWGRPRPKQIVEFGGNQFYRPYYYPNFFYQPEPSKSFPCGHCSMGFYFFSVAFIGRKEGNKHLYLLGLSLAIGLGGLLSIARMAQGGHFFSDILFSAFIMWLTGYGCTEGIYKMFRGRLSQPLLFTALRGCLKNQYITPEILIEKRPK